MKFVFAIVLVAIFAVAAASPANEESDFALLPLIASWALKKYGKKDATESDKIDWSRFKKHLTTENLQKAVDIWKILKQKDATESDAEFFKKLQSWWSSKGKNLFEKGKNLFNKGKEIYAILKNKSAPESDKINFKKIGSIAKKGFEAYKKIKGLGFFADKINLKKIGSIAKKGFETYKKIKGLGFFADKINFAGLKKYATKENLSKAISIYKKIKSLKNKSESDKFDWSKVKKYLTPENLQKAVDIWKILKRKQSTESDVEFKFLKKIGGIAKKGFSLYQKAKGLGFFADKLNLKKIGSIAKKGFETYKKIKGLGFFDDAESDMQFRDALVAKLKDRVKGKLQQQLKEGGKKLCVLTKLRAKPFCAARSKVESDKINWKSLFSQKNLEKAVGIYKAIKGGDSEESDAEFLKKLKTWWSEKGKGLFEKGKNLFNKGKEIYAILKNKSESDKIDWSKVKKYLTPENLQKAVDIWKVLKNKDATESDFYGQVAQFLGKKALEQAGKFGYNKIFRRKDEAEEQAPAEKPAKKQKKPATGVTLKGLVAKLRKQRAAAAENKDGKKKFNFKNLLAKVQKLRNAKKPAKDGEKPKRKFDIKSLLAKIAKKRAEKKQKKEKKVEEPQQVNDQASG